MKTIVALPGEGIGIEVVEAACEVLEGTGAPLKILHPPQGAAALKNHGTPIPEETKRAAREADGVLFGAGRFAVKVVTPAGVERIARFAVELARKRQARGKPGKVTCVTKSNVLPKSDGLFQQISERVVRNAGLPFEHFHVDDAARRLVRFPKSMDVVLCMNLYGDILSDLAAETAGGLGLAPSGCFGDGWAYFESVHGSAPDIAGQGIANPTATILSAAMMLDHMGLAAEAQRLEAAVGRVYRDRKALTPDQGGGASTREMTRAVLAAYRNT